MPLPAEQKALSVVVGALRAKFPELGKLTDDELIERFNAQAQVKRLTKYYEMILSSNVDMGRQLSNVG